MNTIYNSSAFVRWDTHTLKSVWTESLNKKKYPYYEFYRYLHETFNTWLMKISIDFTTKSTFQFYFWIWCLLKKYGRVSSIVEYNILSEFIFFPISIHFLFCENPRRMTDSINSFNSTMNYSQFKLHLMLFTSKSVFFLFNFDRYWTVGIWCLWYSLIIVAFLSSS